jgi:hypothetical protein
VPKSPTGAPASLRHYHPFAIVILSKAKDLCSCCQLHLTKASPSILVYFQ